MNVFLAQLDWTPFFYGVVIFIGLLSMILKLKYGKWLAFTCEAAVFWLVFRLHGGTMAGGFAATVAALISGVALPMLFPSTTRD